jgi:hypothetical protein
MQCSLPSAGVTVFMLRKSTTILLDWSYASQLRNTLALPPKPLDRFMSNEHRTCSSPVRKMPEICVSENLIVFKKVC